MPWNRDDYLAAAFIIGIIILGILAILWITGNNPRKSDVVYPFGSIINVELSHTGSREFSMWFRKILMGILTLLGILSIMEPEFS